MQTLNLEDFNYHLPEDLIAQEPLAQRSSSRLLVRYKDGSFEHSLFEKLASYLPKGTRLIYNDSRVIPGRLYAKTEHGGRVELMLLKPLNSSGNTWEALGRPFRKLLPGVELQLEGACRARIKRQYTNQPQPCVEVEFNLPFSDFMSWMEQCGYIPLPPYIDRKDPSPTQQNNDRERYQTVYANEQGSVAAPTAGLHFSSQLWSALKAQGIVPVPLTLHVGGGTFLPVKTQDLSAHSMHTERYRISSASWRELSVAAEEGFPLIAVGTTSLRCLESFVRLMKSKGEGPEVILDRWLETDLFLYPKSRTEKITPWGISGLITNFHQPESSLLMLVAALIGYEGMREMYQCAVEKQYRFLSYGDASLLFI